jgi:hypothetical protein
MIGCLATASPDPKCWSTFEPTYCNGGNMDLRELSKVCGVGVGAVCVCLNPSPLASCSLPFCALKGASILLPVQVEGGLLYLGDLHAAMGAGASCVCVAMLLLNFIRAGEPTWYRSSGSLSSQSLQCVRRVGFEAAGTAVVQGMLGCCCCCCCCPRRRWLFCFGFLSVCCAPSDCG